MNVGVHLAVRFHIIAKNFVPWLKKRTISISIHEGAGTHAQIVPKPNDIDDIANGIAYLFECGQVSYQELITSAFR